MGAAGNRKTIFITGGASGIGAATAKHFVKNGWFAGLYDIDAEKLAQTAAEIGADNCVSGRLDVRDRAEWTAALNHFAEATDGRMDVLVNNAGLARVGGFADQPGDDHDLVVDVNLKGVINGCYCAAPLLEKTPNARIVNIASVAGFVPLPRGAVYSATKFAVRGLTESLNVEFAPKGITVVSVAPWFIETPLLDQPIVEGGNERLRDRVKSVGVYSVDLAAEKTWEAAHGAALHVSVGAKAKRARLLARFAPWLIRRSMKRAAQDA